MATSSCFLKAAAPQTCVSSFTRRGETSHTRHPSLVPIQQHLQLSSFHGLQLTIEAQSKQNAVRLAARQAVKSELRDSKSSRQVSTKAVAEAIERSTLDERLDSKGEYSVKDEAVNDSEVPAFDWKAHWYAVGVVEDMDKSLPHPLLLLGQPVVLWYDRNMESWRCFLDQCPHRLAPLSEGRIDEEGRLQCSYHGWSFEGKGACSCIPQAATQGPESKAAASPRAAARTFPVSEAGGLLFVWPDSAPKAAFKAAYTELPLTPGITPEFTASHYARDLEYGYEILAENLMDPAHVPFSHSGVGGITRTSATPLDFRLERLDPTGFFGTGVSGQFAKNTVGGNEFHAPNRFSYTRTTAREDGSVSNFIITVAITPRGPGKSRVILSTYTKLGNRTEKKKTFLDRVKGLNPRQLLFRFRPKWLSHLVLDAIFDGDAVFLRGQEMILQSTPPPQKNGAASPFELGVRRVDAPNEYFMPTSSDRFVLAFRQWLNKYAGGGVPWAKLGVSDYDVKPTSREDVMDRFHQHTTQCVTCKSAMEKARKARTALWVVSALLMSTIVVAGSDLPVLYRVALATLALLSAGGGVGLSNVIQRFVYTGYSHAK